MTTPETDNPLGDSGITTGTTAVFSMKQAAKVAGVSVSTLRRRRTDLIAAGADISPEGWKVPMTALVACGLIVGEGPQATATTPHVGVRPSNHPERDPLTQRVQELTEHVGDLEREIAEWRRRAEVAEARAEERGRALDALRVANETERMALRMLTAGTSLATPLERVEQPRPPEPVMDSAPMPQARPAREPRQSTPDAQHEERQSEEPRRKGFISRIMGL